MAPMVGEKSCVDFGGTDFRRVGAVFRGVFGFTDARAFVMALLPRGLRLDAFFGFGFTGFGIVTSPAEAGEKNIGGCHPRVPLRFTRGYSLPSA